MSLDDTSGSNNPYRLPRHVIPTRYELRLEPDLARATFTGKAVVSLTITQPTTVIVMNAVDLSINQAEIAGPTGAHQAASIELDEPLQRCRVTFAQTLAPGEWTVRLTFQGTLNDKLRGFYRSTYKDQSGTTRTMAATQFEATDARRRHRPCRS